METPDKDDDATDAWAAAVCKKHGLAQMNSWELFDKACWECGAIQVVFPEHYYCDRCRNE